MKLVIFPPIDSLRLQSVAAAAGSMRVVNAANEAEAMREMPDATAFFGKITPQLLAAAKKLRWVQSPTASLEHFVFSELISHPCVLTNMRGLFSDVIADHVLSYVLCFARNLHIYLRQQSNGVWSPVGGEESRTSFSSGPGVVSAMDRAHLHLADTSMGIIGYGHIGREVARRATAFGIQVSAVDPQWRMLNHMRSEPTMEVLPLTELPSLLSRSDFVVVAAPHTPETEGLFRRAQFQQMKPSSYFINIGRGAIVSLDDLHAALVAKEIAGAALDVFEQEPLPPDHPLWRLDSVILTPHVAACSPRIAERHLAVLVGNVRRFVAGEPLLNVADKARWY